MHEAGSSPLRLSVWIAELARLRAEAEAAQLRKDDERAARQRENQAAKSKGRVMDAFFKSARAIGREISRTIFGARRR